MKDDDTTIKWALWFLTILAFIFVMNVLEMVFV